MDTQKTRVNPSEETMQMGATGIGIRFLLTQEDTNGSMSVFEVYVPAGQKLTAPAHKNDAYEEVLYGIQGVLTWTVDGQPIEVAAAGGPPDRAQMSEIFRRHGMTVAPPHCPEHSPSPLGEGWARA